MGGCTEVLYRHGRAAHNQVIMQKPEQRNPRCQLVKPSRVENRSCKNRFLAPTGLCSKDRFLQPSITETGLCRNRSGSRTGLGQEPVWGTNRFRSRTGSGQKPVRAETGLGNINRFMSETGSCQKPDSAKTGTCTRPIRVETTHKKG